MTRLMKKLFLTLSLVAITIMGMAQEREYNFFVKAGINVSDISNKIDYTEKVGIKLGAGFDFYFNQHMGMQTGLFISSKGAKLEKTTINAVYLECPMKATARFKVNKLVNVVFNGGPYLAYGIGGKIKTENDPYEAIEKNSFGKDRLNRLDAGLEFGIATEIKCFVIGIDTQFGLTKMNTPAKMKNQTIGFSLGCKF